MEVSTVQFFAKKDQLYTLAVNDLKLSAKLFDPIKRFMKKVKVLNWVIK
jgi:hypothetical protein